MSVIIGVRVAKKRKTTSAKSSTSTSSSSTSSKPNTTQTTSNNCNCESRLSALEQKINNINSCTCDKSKITTLETLITNLQTQISALQNNSSNSSGNTSLLSKKIILYPHAYRENDVNPNDPTLPPLTETCTTSIDNIGFTITTAYKDRVTVEITYPETVQITTDVPNNYISSKQGKKITITNVIGEIGFEQYLPNNYDLKAISDTTEYWLIFDWYGKPN